MSKPTIASPHKSSDSDSFIINLSGNNRLPHSMGSKPCNRLSEQVNSVLSPHVKSFPTNSNFSLSKENRGPKFLLKNLACPSVLSGEVGRLWVSRPTSQPSESQPWEFTPVLKALAEPPSLFAESPGAQGLTTGRPLGSGSLRLPFTFVSPGLAWHPNMAQAIGVSVG